MKNRIIILLAAVIIIPMFFISCEEELDTPPIATINPDMVLEISDLYQIYTDSGEYVFTDNYMLYGTITMDDVEGNIYKEAYIEDSTGGVNLYKFSYTETVLVGQYVRINLKGAELIDYEGKLEVKFNDTLDTDKSIIIQSNDVPLTPKVVTIADIETGEYKCELVKIENLQFTVTDTSKTYATSGGTFATNRNAEDCNGGSIIIRTSDYSDFAGYDIPNGNGSLVGIVTLYRDDWQVLIRSIDEVDMDGERCN